MSDLIGSIETQATEVPGKLRLPAICTLSIVVVMMPVLIVELAKAHRMPMPLAGLFYLVLDLLLLSPVLLFSRSRGVGDLELVWWRRRHSEVR